ncbi:hypoxanthine/guanine phosphoribosyltransferase, putative [Syntrophotalea carbinolica DSM 2380]|uniref:Hypoxanthine phosphoribosyltransferase n=1 Tax=Syntrophotalea carbinolica (strain DSM 2380 / NBRC 103641 / GraBd1) TaxID=338963 RepID=Q3A1H2_SYNC1|nr:hypoxanthine phosphoribosyltransferase [Syntrophotalea carbinolica]ABA89785.1 hypoxanthine/guanine phosphoribosyltransferase, putative [Syntrophotalea carbinolica DSM 2380]
MLDSLKILYTRDQIAEQVRRLGSEINRDYAGREILLVCVLKGSFLFFADLVRTLTCPVVVDFVRLASYGCETISSGVVEMRKDLEFSVTDRDVVIVEDIVDTGYTLQTLYHRLLDRKPRSLKICTLLDKRVDRRVDIEADYIGLALDDGFVVGYGLDYQEKYRELPDLYVLEDAPPVDEERPI